MAVTGFLYGTFAISQLFDFQEGLEHQIVGARHRGVVQLARRRIDLGDQFLDV